MSRWIGFIGAVFVTYTLLGVLPVIGPLVRGTGLIGLWITILLTSWLISRGTEKLIQHQREQRQIQSLEAVVSPHSRGKLAALHLARGRTKVALPLLEEAVAGDPESLEWRNHLATALWAERRGEEAIKALESVLKKDPEYGFGNAQMRYAEYLLGVGREQDSVEAVLTFERNHGESPESAYRMGMALSGAGDKSGAREHFQRVRTLAKSVPAYQQKEARKWVAKSVLKG